MIKRPGLLPINRAPDSTRPFSISDDEWYRRATTGAIQQIRKILGALPVGTRVVSLSDHELGWIVAAAIFGWVSTRGQQAALEGISTETALCRTGISPDPWDVGAIITILPKLAELDFDWSKSLAELSRDEIASFLCKALLLAREAIATRNRGERCDGRDPAEAEGFPADNFFDPNAENND